MSFISRISEEDHETSNNLFKRVDENNHEDVINENEIEKKTDEQYGVRFTVDNFLNNGNLETSDEAFAAEPKFMTNYREQLYDAVVRGQIEKVEQLLDLPYADIDFTWYSENLLMCAIRSKQEKMAEYLIHRGIDVTYEVDLIEFHEKSKVPIRYQYYSCRQMAYDYDMPNVVALIDFFNENTNKKIVKYIGRKLLKSTDIRNKECSKILNRQKLLEKRLLETFIKKKDNENNNRQSTSCNSSRENSRNESMLYDELDSIKPGSSFDDSKQKINNPKNSINDETSNDFDSEPIPYIDLPETVVIDKEYELKVTNNLTKSIGKRLDEKQSNLLSNELPKRKEFTFKGYKIAYSISYDDEYEQKETKNNNDNFKLNDKNNSKNNQSKHIEPTIVSTLPLTTKTNTTRPTTSTSRFSFKSVKSSKPDTNNNNNNFNSNSKYSIDQFSLSLSSKYLPSRVKSRPMTTVSNFSSYTPRNIDARTILSGKYSTVSDAVSFKSSLEKTKLKINQKENKNSSNKLTYIEKLRKSGLANDYCVPILRSKHITGVIATK